MSDTKFKLELDADILDHALPNIDLEELKKYCDLIYNLANRKKISLEAIGKKTISDYYKTSGLLYRNFHSETGAMHLPIAESRSQTHKEKLLFQAKTIHEAINKNNCSNILELGCGMGFNSIYLAKQNPEKTFTSLDLTPQNLQFAKKRAKDLKNITFNLADFDQLELGNQKFDLIFAVETLCHSKNINVLLSKLKQYLNEGGRIIIFDGYIKENARQLIASEEKDAYRLTSWGFAMERFQTVAEVLEAVQAASFELANSVEYSKNVLSNLIAFQKGAKNVLRFSGLLKLLISLGVIPMAFIKQISAGFFSAYFIQTGFFGYYKFELIKKSAT